MPTVLIPANQGHAEDVILWHRYNYYVLGCGLIADGLYDMLEAAMRAKWSVSVCDEVGSSNPGDYPDYIREGRKPLERERIERDRAITLRWMKAL